MVQNNNKYNHSDDVLVQDNKGGRYRLILDADYVYLNTAIPQNKVTTVRQKCKDSMAGLKITTTGGDIRFILPSVGALSAFSLQFVSLSQGTAVMHNVCYFFSLKDQIMRSN